MSIEVTYNGTDYRIPSPGEADWANALNAYLIALATPPAGGVATLAAVGASPNANAGTIAGTVLNLQPASTSFPGVLSAADKTKIDALPSVVTYLYTTPGDTPYNLTTRVIPTGKVYAIIITSLCLTNAGAAPSGSERRVGTFRNSGGTVAQCGTTGTIWSQKSTAAWAAGFTYATNTVTVELNGITGASADWTVTVETLVIA